MWREGEEVRIRKRPVRHKPNSSVCTAPWWGGGKQKPFQKLRGKRLGRWSQGQSHSTSKAQTRLSSWWDSDSQTIAQVCGRESSYRVTLQDPQCGPDKILKSIFKNWVKNTRPHIWGAACRRTQPRRSWRNEKKERSYADTVLIYNTLSK